MMEKGFGDKYPPCYQAEFHVPLTGSRNKSAVSKEVMFLTDSSH